MSKLPRLFTVLAATVCAVVVTATIVLAKAPRSADVVRAEGCVFFDGNGAPVADFEARVQIVLTNNKNGNYTATCHGQLPEGSVLPTSAQHNDFDSTGFVCINGADWKGTTSPSGKASFTCQGKLF